MFLRISDLGYSGVNTDLASVDMPDSTFTYGSNFRILNGKVSTFNTNILMVVNPNSINVGLIQFIPNSVKDFYLLAGITTVLAFDGLTFTDITPLTPTTLTAGQEYYWCCTMISSIPVLSNPSTFPQYWSPQTTSTRLQYLNFDSTHTWKVKNYTCKTMRVCNNFLFALGMIEGGIEYSDTYRWSHPSDNGSLPFSWDETALDTIAGKSSLGGKGGGIVDGLQLRDDFVIYSKYSIDILSYVGGEFVWNRRAFSNSYGLFAINCVTEAEGFHYFISTDGDAVVTDGNSINSLFTDRVKKQFVSSINSTAKVKAYVVKNIVAKEVWFCIAELGYDKPSIAYIYNYLTKAISIRDFKKHPYSSMTFGPTLEGAITWDSIGYTWDAYNQPWSYSPSSKFANQIIAIDHDTSNIYSLEYGSSTVVAPPLVWSNVTSSWSTYVQNWDYIPPNSNLLSTDYESQTVIERHGLQIGAIEETKSIKSVWPFVITTGKLYIQLGAQDRYGAPIRWKPAVVYDPVTMYKADIRNTGKLQCWKISSYDVDMFTLSGFDIEYENGGTR